MPGQKRPCVDILQNMLFKQFKEKRLCESFFLRKLQFSNTVVFHEIFKKTLFTEHLEAIASARINT